MPGGPAGHPEQSPVQRTRLHPRPNAFTLIELLAVIAILGILTGLLFVAFKGISGTAGAQATNVLLGNAKNLLAEYELTQKLSDLDANLNGDGTDHGSSACSGGPPFVAGDFPSETIAGRIYDEEQAPGLVTADAYPGVLDRYSGGSANFAVAHTQIVMGRLLAVPANRKAIGSIPSDGLLRQPPPPPGGASNLKSDVAGQSSSPPVLLDSYKNPILYIPAGGLIGVNVADRMNQRVTSRGVVDAADAPPAGSRPFFASAGKDGNFATGDDNVYSFSN